MRNKRAKHNVINFLSLLGFASQNNEKRSNDFSPPNGERESGSEIELHRTRSVFGLVGLVGPEQAQEPVSIHTWPSHEIRLPNPLQLSPLTRKLIDSHEEAMIFQW